MMRKVALTILIVAAMLAPVYAEANGSLGALLGSINTTVDVAPTKSAETPKETGISTSEVLPGNGTRAGYVLGHGNIIPNSEWVDIGTKHGARNRDYSIDYASGTLFFTEPVRQMDSVRVDYRYSPQSKTERNVTAPGILPFRFGNTLQMGMVYSYRAADTSLGFNTPDVLTYGMNSVLKFGGASSLSSMVYMATPQASNRMSLDATPQVPNKDAKQIKKDHLMVQNADLGLGKVRLKLGFQDVGQDFAGFNSLRDSNAAPADILNQLEKEKGIKRMSVSGAMPSGNDAGLSFAFGQIEDKTDSIISESLAYATGNFKLNFSTRDVGKNFTRFKDLADADRGQLAAEAGMNRTNYGMQFRTGMTNDKKPVWSGLNITQLVDGNKSLSYESANLDVGKVNIQADIRTMDPMFNRLGALSDEERSRMALIARRQFNPVAQMSEVTGDDKTQINNEAGLDRSTYIVQVDGGQVDTWLSLSSVDSQKGSVNRRSINISSKRGSVYFNTQTVDKDFQRLGALQPVERAHYGNEFGLNRTEMGGKLKIAGGDIAIDSASVLDHQGAGMLREAVDFKNARIKFHANFQDIDHRFNRIMDLSDGDKKMMLQELGFKRSDYSINFQATKFLNVDTYLYNSTNITAGQTRGQSRHKITYTPDRGPKINALLDNYSYVSEDGNLSNYFHREIKFDNTFNLMGGLHFKGRNDTYTTQEGEVLPTTTVVSENHLESDQKARTSFTMDVVNLDLGNGKFDNLQSIGIKTQAVRNLSLVGGYASSARDSGKSEMNGRFGFEWAIKKDLKMTFSMANRNGGPQGGQQARQFSLNGPIAKRFLLFNDITVASGTNTTMTRGKHTICDNGFKLDAGVMGGKITLDNTDKLNPKNGIYYTSRVFQYESSKDPKCPFHLTYFRQNLITPAGTPAKKRNYALDVKISNDTNMTFTSYLGKDGQNGVVLPVGGTIFKINHLLNNGMTLMADYTKDTNTSTNRRARVMGLGFSGTTANKSTYEFYYGWCNLFEGSAGTKKNIFRLKYDSKVDADHFITFTLQRKSGIDKTTINPYEGDTVGRIDFRILFN